MRRAPAAAKINLSLVVGSRGPEGRHEVTTVLQRVDLTDRIELQPAGGLEVSGFAQDTLVRRALGTLAEAARVEPCWHARITKRIPVAAGLGGGSSDAATALLLANETLEQPLDLSTLTGLARSIGADVPFFLRPGPQLGEADGGVVSPLELPQDYWVLLLLPHGATKASTAAVYEAFDARGGEEGHVARREVLREALGRVRVARDLAALPGNDLVSSPLARNLGALGAFRADVSGAGPVLYGLFEHRSELLAAARRARAWGRVWTTVPAWYV